MQTSPSATAAYPVNSHNEWDPLEEVIVGDLTDATIPSGPGAAICDAPRLATKFQPLVAGFRYPQAVLNSARKELDGFVSLLEREGVCVRRPDPQPFNRTFSTPVWNAQGYSCASPRDSVLIVGDHIIEAPMSWRSRYFETFAYRSLFREYFRAGARWTAAPKPELHEPLYNEAYPNCHAGVNDDCFVVREHEPVFDAADFVRCGTDLFAIRSNTTNLAGIEWLGRHLNARRPADQSYRIHLIPIRNIHAMHIDVHFMPLAPGKALVNPEWVVLEHLRETVPALKGWEFLPAPPPDAGHGVAKFANACSKWLNMNVLSLDERRVIVEKSQKSMISALRSWGFEPITCPFEHYSTFGGAFHCATLDVRRRGSLQSYCG